MFYKPHLGVSVTNMGGYSVMCLLVVYLVSTTTSERGQRGDIPTYKADSDKLNSVCPASVIANANRLFGGKHMTQLQ